MLNKIFLISLMLTIFSCCDTVTSNPTTPVPTPVVTDSDQCPLAEKHLNDLCNQDVAKNAYCCALAAPTKKGKSYTQFCQEEQQKGIFLNPKCIANVVSCDKNVIDACTHSN